MCRGLVSQGIRNDIALNKTVKQVNRIAQHPDTPRLSFPSVMYSGINGIINIGMFLVQVTRFYPFINPPFFHFGYQGHPFIHGDGQGLCAAHAA